jgi:protein disulfide-isomerase
MRYLVLLILLIGAVFLYSSVTQTKDAKSNTTEVAEYSASWLKDLSVVLAKAKEEGKPILMNFTESKLCGWCIKLKKEVFSKPVFIDYANEHLILMTVDFPRGVQQEESLIDQNYQLLDAFGIYQFPTIILVDTEGNIIGRTGYLRGGPKAYVDHLKDMLAKEIQ